MMFVYKFFFGLIYIGNIPINFLKKSGIINYEQMNIDLNI